MHVKTCEVLKQDNLIGRQQSELVNLKLLICKISKLKYNWHGNCTTR